MPKQRLREKILDKAAEKELDRAGIVKGAGISASHLDAILDNNAENIPAFPYIRHQLVNLADFLGLDQEDVLSSYKEDFSQKISGVYDRLPSNRYSLPSQKQRLTYLGGVVLIIFLIYLAVQGLIGSSSEIEISFPPSNPIPFVVHEQSIVLKGKISSQEKLTINGQTTPVDADGAFQRDYLLSPEMNYLEFRVNKVLGEDSVLIREVYFEPSEDEPTQMILPLEDATTTPPEEEPLFETPTP